MSENKSAYFRRGNEIFRDESGNITFNTSHYIIIGDETEIGGRDNAYKHKGLVKQSQNAGIVDIDGNYTGTWQRIYPNIELNERVTRDYDLHEFVKKECHDICAWTGEKDNPENPLETREAFEIFGKDNLDIERNIEELYRRLKIFVDGTIKREIRPIYEDIVELVCVDILEKINMSSNPHIIGSLCTRYGKCSTETLLFALSDARILLLTGYIKTIFPSIKRDCEFTAGFENILFIMPEDIENYELDYKKCKEWLDADPEHKIIYGLALTGTFNEDDDTAIVNMDDNLTTYKRRIKLFESLQNDYLYAMTLDEVDFGTHCERQIKKLYNIGIHKNCQYRFSITGTNAEKAEKIWKADYYISRTLIDLWNEK